MKSLQYSTWHALAQRTWSLGTDVLPGHSENPFQEAAQQIGGHHTRSLHGTDDKNSDSENSIVIIIVNSVGGGSSVGKGHHNYLWKLYTLNN